MSESLGVFDARTRFSELIDRAEHGEEIIVTRRGRPVARIVPALVQPVKSPEERQQIIDEFRKLRERVAAHGGQVTQEEIAAWKAEGRR